MKTLIALAAAALMSSAASAAVVLDFNLPIGADVSQYYNGGTYATNGPAGPNLGITFTGSDLTVRRTAEFDGYIGNRFGGKPFTVTFDPAIARVAGQDLSAVSFIFNSGDEDAYIEFGGGTYYDRQTVGISGCRTNEECNQMNSSRIAETYNYFTARFAPDVSSITFYGLSIDNLSFSVIGPEAQILARTEIPEPASLALVGLGIAGLAIARRKTRQR